MPTQEHVVIVGGGQAGARTATQLRRKGFTGTVTILAAEQELPYERPPLSKEYLKGEQPFEKAQVHPEQWYADNEVDLRLGARVVGLDPAAHEVTLRDGTTVGYDTLVLATGSIPRKLKIDGSDADGVFYLRTRRNSEAIRGTFGEGRRLAVIGGGWIGLEVAAAAVGAGTHVTVVEAADLPLERVLGPDMARVYAEAHRAHGVDLRLGAGVEAIETRDGAVTGVRLSDGSTVQADAVVIGVGARPDTMLAEKAGLAVADRDAGDGVLVDASLRTSDPDIYAVGDIANVDHPVLGHCSRVEHWHSALQHPKVVAAKIVGEKARFEDLPYFYSDQYDLGMEYVGDARGDEQVVTRGDVDGHTFLAFWVDGERRIRAAMAVNTWDVLDQVKPFILDGTPVDTARLADPDVPLGEWA